MDLRVGFCINTSTNRIYTNLNEKASIAIDTDKRRTAQRTFEIYRNAVHPILLAGSYKKN